MLELNPETESLLSERFGKDTVVALATIENDAPRVRYVNAYYENGAFYIITYALSDKLRQLEKNPSAAIAGEWFTAQGRGENLGWFGSRENREIADKLRKAFAAWIDNGHNDYNDKNTVILRVELTGGLLMSHGRRYTF